MSKVLEDDIVEVEEVVLIEGPVGLGHTIDWVELVPRITRRYWQNRKTLRGRRSVQQRKSKTNSF